MIFDWYHRPIKVDIRRRHVQVSVQRREFRFENGSVLLPRHLTRVTASNDAATVYWTKPTPNPLQVLNSPPLNASGDGSYEYIPDVVGGVEPYVFRLDQALPAGFTFNAATGRLYRPPA